MVLELMRFTEMVGVSLSVQSRRLSSLPQFYAHSSAVLLEVAASFPVFMPLSCSPDFARCRIALPLIGDAEGSLLGRATSLN